MSHVVLCGVRIDSISLEEVVNNVEKIISNNRKDYIVTPNAAHIVLLQKDNELKEVYENACLVLPDGMSIIWAAKILGTSLKRRITGIDLLFSLSRLAIQNNYSVFFLGAKEEIVRKVNEKLKQKFSYLKIAGFHNGYIEDNMEVIKKINKSRTDILFIGMGFPKQEKWIYENMKLLSIKVAVCIGGVFDIIAGKAKRAPKWMQKYGLEWFFRFIQEPRRLWKRYLIGNTIFIWMVLKKLFEQKVFKRYV